MTGYLAPLFVEAPPEWILYVGITLMVVIFLLAGIGVLRDLNDEEG